MLDFRMRNAAMIKRVKNGQTYTEVAADYGVSRERVRQICVREGVTSLNNRPLSHEEKEEIERLFWMGMRPRHIAQEVGRGENMIADYLEQVGLRARDNDGIATDQWTRKEDAILRKFYGVMRARAIGTRLGRTKNEVIGRAGRLGLSKSRKARLITIDGVTRSLTEWAEISGVAKNVIWQRLALGWKPAAAVMLAVDKRYQNGVGRPGVR